jgi:hypothetical protein
MVEGRVFETTMRTQDEKPPHALHHCFKTSYRVYDTASLTRNKKKAHFQTEPGRIMAYKFMNSHALNDNNSVSFTALEGFCKKVCLCMHKPTVGPCITGESWSRNQVVTKCRIIKSPQESYHNAKTIIIISSSSKLLCYTVKHLFHTSLQFEWSGDAGVARQEQALLEQNRDQTVRFAYVISLSVGR